ncbi:polysaccharide biosynthesis/export family protein [Prosthecobacter sp.]|uniref:polysaccharide biosynthesis/export family protein n=1 Tax=Prosthecobacter sp. TaxID=1965333 RepID=UPI0037832364
MPHWIVPFFLFWLCVGGVHAQQKPLPAMKNIMDVLDDRHTLVPGDTVSIRVLEDRRADDRRVPEDGMIEVTYVGTVKAEGMTCRKLAQFIRQKLVAVPLARRPFYSEGPTVVVALNNGTHCGPPSMDELDNNIKLRPGWTIGLRILEDKREKLQQIIAVTGEVRAPYVGLVKAGGLTCAEVAVNIKRELEKAFFLTATVLVTLDSTTSDLWHTVTGCFPEEVICVFGKVANAGKYDLSQRGDLTVSGFLRWAGGHTSKKPFPKIQIVRKTPQGNKRILVDTEAILIRKSKEHDLFLRSCDVMLVE